MKIIKQIPDFFPIRLLIIHVKHNLILLIFWVFLFSIVTEQLGENFGIPYLFLDPEYMGQVNEKSLYVLGIFLGIFTISFQVTSYILNAYKFPFLTTLRRPFITYSINNAFFPLLFLVGYAVLLHRFHQSEPEHLVLGLLGGYITAVTLALVYFGSANRNRFLGTENIEKKIDESKMARRKKLQDLRALRSGKFKVEHFIGVSFRLRKVAFPDRFIEPASVFDKNHMNALIFELFIFALILMVNYFDHVPLFKIPAGASILIFLTLMIMVTGALFYWMRRWAFTALVGILLVLNFAYGSRFWNRDYHAVGLCYDNPVEYSITSMKEHTRESDYYDDRKHGIQMLENWKSKQLTEKPKITLICTSGGGLRSALWTYISLQNINKETNDRFFNSSMLITGASGGMIGAAYYRELYLQNDTLPYDSAYSVNISKDLLNPIALKLLVNDMLPFSKDYIMQNREVKADRGTVFERELNDITEGVLNKKMIDYNKPEIEAKIPMMILSPTILNDGRSLFISAQPIAYMTLPDAEDSRNMAEEVQGIEFRKLFRDHNADSLSFLTALRMNASFPYVSPSITLPSNPPISLTDAGMTDNYGIVNALKFLHTFRSWINENTSGVIIVSIRDHVKETPLKKYSRPGLFKKLINPIGGFYSNWTQFQDFSQDNMLRFANSWLDQKLDVLHFEYTTGKEGEKGKASLSWHLTEAEKQNIKDAIFTPTNRQKIEQLKKMLDVE